MRIATYGHLSRPKYPRFLASDGFTVWSKKIQVIEIDGGDDSAVRLVNVGGVESAAETDLAAGVKPAVGTGTAILSGGTVVLGQDQDSVGGGFEASQSVLGLLDDVRIYAYARTPAQVAAAALTQAESIARTSTDGRAPWRSLSEATNA